MLVTYNSILIITALLPNLNATAPKNPGWKLEQRCSICADTVYLFFILHTVFLHKQFWGILLYFRGESYLSNIADQLCILVPFNCLNEGMASVFLNFLLSKVFGIKSRETSCSIKQRHIQKKVTKFLDFITKYLRN